MRIVAELAAKEVFPWRPAAAALDLSAPSPYSRANPSRGRCFKTPFRKAAKPPRQRGFVTSGFWLCAPQGALAAVTGGMGLTVRLPALLCECFQHPVHPPALENASEWVSSLAKEN